jgi:hypothetical protein
MPTTYTLITSNTLSSSAASVTFSAIPNTFTDIVVRASARSDFSAAIDSFIMRINADSTSNYSETRLVAYAGTSILTDRYSNQTSIQNITLNGDTSTSNTFSVTEIYIPSYLSTVSKAIPALSVVENNSTTVNQILTDAALYRGTSAISSIAFTPSAGTNFLSGSSFYLYGIKNS